MLICEEYFKRHSIKDKFIRYDDKGSLFLKPEKASNYIVITIDWVTQKLAATSAFASETNIVIDRIRRGGPGVFLLKFLIPAQKESNYFSRLSSKFLELEEYETFMLKWSREVDSDRVAKTYEEILSQAWDMFLYCRHDWISFNFDIKEIREITLSESIPFEQRSVNIDKLLLAIEKKSFFVYNIWLNHYEPLIKNYSFWLCNLINKKEDLDYDYK